MVDPTILDCIFNTFPGKVGTMAHSRQLSYAALDCEVPGRHFDIVILSKAKDLLFACIIAIPALRSRIMRRLLVVIAITATIKLSLAEAPPIHCKTPENGASCQPMHGRLAIYNGGAPNFRLWQSGTNHLYGIFTDKHDRDCTRSANQYGRQDDENPNLPRNLAHAFDVPNPFHITVYADFEVCPLERPITGHMQDACIESATHLFIKRD